MLNLCWVLQWRGDPIQLTVSAAQKVLEANPMCKSFPMAPCENTEPMLNELVSQVKINGF